MYWQNSMFSSSDMMFGPKAHGAMMTFPFSAGVPNMLQEEILGCRRKELELSSKKSGMSGYIFNQCLARTFNWHE